MPTENCSTTVPQIRTEAAKAFYNAVVNGDISLYFFIGKADAWTSEGSPDAVNDTVNEHWSAWDSMYALKKIDPANISLVVARNDWEKDSVYDKYDDTDSDLYTDRNFYVYVQDDIDANNNQIYKCIDNYSASNQSKILPDSFNRLGVFGTEYVAGDEDNDGYKWIFIGSFNECAADKFLTDDVMPVATLTSDDDSLHWQAQESAIPGGVHKIVVTTAGSGYTDGTHRLDVSTLNSSGSGLIADATVASGVVTGVSVINPGQNYRHVSLSMPSSAGSGSSATFRAIIAPYGGHGSDIVRELKPNSVCVYALMQGSEEEIIPVENEYRQYGLVVNPLDAETGEIATEDVYKQHTVLTIGTITNQSGDKKYILDEWVYQGASLDTASAKARVLEWKESDPTKLKVINVRGSFTRTSIVRGATSLAKATISTIDSGPEMIIGSGELVYLVNRTKVERDENQREEYKLTITF